MQGKKLAQNDLTKCKVRNRLAVKVRKKLNALKYMLKGILLINSILSLNHYGITRWISVLADAKRCQLIVKYANF